MNETQKRLEAVEDLIQVAEKEAKGIWWLNEAVSKVIIGLPYYWGEYSGVLEASESKPGKVVAHIKSQKTGEECYWSYDSMVAYEHLKEIAKYSSWEEYDTDRKIMFAEHYEQTLLKYNYSKDVFIEKMKEYCTKFEIPYKTYFTFN